MEQKTILVIQGGTSSERKVSLNSGKACTRALKKLKYKVLTFDPAKEHLSKIKKYKQKVNLIFNALHGRDGEDGIAQSYFEYFEIPYTHSGVISSMNAMDKITSKKIFKKNNLLTPNYIALNSVNYKKSLKELSYKNINNYNNSKLKTRFISLQDTAKWTLMVIGFKNNSQYGEYYVCKYSDT